MSAAFDEAFDFNAFDLDVSGAAISASDAPVTVCTASDAPVTVATTTNAAVTDCATSDALVVTL